jgi:hypothetical protein
MSNNWLLRNTSSDDDVSNLKVAHLLGRRYVTKGDVGLEIEVEGNCFPKEEEIYDDEDNCTMDRDACIPREWRYVHDGSLRGQDNAEYVLEEPIPFDEVPQALRNLWDMFEGFGSKLDESNRTSVHVHLNATEFYLNQVCAFVALYVAVEEVLTAWCGDHRVGNLFCLRAKDAPAIISKARSFICTGNTAFLDDGLHYSGLNLHSLCKHGSIEIRSMRGVQDPQIIQTWVEILQRIYELSGEHFDPRSVCEMFSGGGSGPFLRYVLGRHTEQVVAECGMSEIEVYDSVRQGIRLAQRLCYAKDWGNFRPVNKEPDPFGRKNKQAVLSSPETTSPLTVNLNDLLDMMASQNQANNDYGNVITEVDPTWTTSQNTSY